MRAALIVAILVFATALAMFNITMPKHIAAYGMFGAIRSAFYIGLLADAVTYGGRQGGGPEKVVAITLMVSTLLDPVMHLLLHARFRTVDPTHLIVDLGCLAVFLTVALRANRLWTLWLCAFHGLSVLSHVAKAFELDIHPIIYAVMEAVWGYLEILLLIAGTWAHQQRLRTNLADPSWSSFSHRWAPPAPNSPGN